MWGVCDFAWLTFLWTFYLPAIAPPFSRSAPRLRWSRIVCPRTEKTLEETGTETLRIFTACWRILIAWMRECSVLDIVTSLFLAFYAFLLCSPYFLLSSSLLLKDVAYPHDKLAISMFRSRFLHTIYMFFACFIPILSCVLFLDLTLQISS